MGSADWLRKIIGVKKNRPPKARHLKDVKSEDPISQEPEKADKISKLLDENDAATRIQAVFRRHQARCMLDLLKRENRLKTFLQGNSVKEQSSSTERHLRSWNKIQFEISARRRSSAIERRLQEKKPRPKSNSLEMGWCEEQGTREEIIARVKRREEAAAKRERAMAYALTHQGRALGRGKTGQRVRDEGGEGLSWNWRWAAKGTNKIGLRLDNVATV
ncbi:protein IQ-DOMAIN 10-like [Wolffia australiana]